MSVDESELPNEPIPLSEPEEAVGPEFDEEEPTPFEPVETSNLLDEATEPAGEMETVAPEPLVAVAEPVSEARMFDALRLLSERIDRKFSDLQTAFDREGRAEASREKVIDRLHAELQDYKQDLLLNTLRPIFIDLIQLHDDIGKVAIVPDDASADCSRFVDLMLGFQEGIEDILYRQGVEPYRVEGELFDARKQRAVATVPTEDAALVKTIAARHRKGFQSGDRVIRPEIVSVHALKK